MAQTTVDHFYGMGKYSSQLSWSQKPFLLIFQQADDDILKLYDIAQTNVRR